MSSANEQLVPPPKPKMSPLDFRNTELVSRLLAATPPYLYNMSLLPNTYFFSEMLRSFVQAKSDLSSRSTSSSFHPRRARKRPWTSANSKPETSPKLEQNNDWSLKSSYTDTKSMDAPLELTTTKITSLDHDSESKLVSSKSSSFNGNVGSDRKIEIPMQEHVEPIFPPLGPETSPPGLILPPPPPIWYPSMYPTTPPYGIDPLHFFIDLRVSGHIYDRKNQRTMEAEQPPTSAPTEMDESRQKHINIRENFKQSRHSSAFSVPVPRSNRIHPINLSHNDDNSEYNTQEVKNLKFDVKSMGFDKSSNKTGTNYIMNNIGTIYKNVTELSHSVKSETSSETTVSNDENLTEEEKEKRVKDLRALIGLELVVDYMNHAKPQPRRISDQNSSAETESAGSPTLEVVALHDET